MDRARLAWFLLVLLPACQGQPQKEAGTGMPEVTFLTRQGCPNSVAMYERLLSALAERGVTQVPVTLDLGELAQEDVRTGYGTPTILVDGVDLFGRGQPEPATPM